MVGGRVGSVSGCGRHKGGRAGCGIGEMGAEEHLLEKGDDSGIGPNAEG